MGPKALMLEGINTRSAFCGVLNERATCKTVLTKSTLTFIARSGFFSPAAERIEALCMIQSTRFPTYPSLFVSGFVPPSLPSPKKTYVLQRPSTLKECSNQYTKYHRSNSHRQRTRVGEKKREREKENKRS